MCKWLREAWYLGDLGEVGLIAVIFSRAGTGAERTKPLLTATHGDDGDTIPELGANVTGGIDYDCVLVPQTITDGEICM